MQGIPAAARKVYRISLAFRVGMGYNITLNSVRRVRL